jgi:isoleucyl-tRNA synthetase
VLIVPAVTIAGGGTATVADVAPGEKCARCWKVLPEVGAVAAHPALCRRCADAVESGLVCKAAAE